jgi:putative ATPase
VETALREWLAQQAPLAARMRPRTLDEMVGQAHLIGPGAPLRALIETDRVSSIILWGPPGTGKTTLARVVAAQTDREFVALSAVSAGVRDVREVNDRARTRVAEEGRGTILFLDEVHRFNKAQQDALLLCGCREPCRAV